MSDPHKHDWYVCVKCKSTQDLTQIDMYFPETGSRSYMFCASCKLVLDGILEKYLEGFE